MSLMYAKKVNNLVEGAATFSQDVKTHFFTCPTGKRWLLIAGAVYRDSADVLYVDLEDGDPHDNGNQILRLAGSGGRIGWAGFPDDESEGAMNGYEAVPIIMNAGEQIRVTFADDQGAGAKITCIVLEVDK